MLGGYPSVSATDLRGSLVFINKLRRTSRHYSANKRLPRAADCGAGIGRVTAGLLSRVAECVDAVEPVAEFAGRVRRLEGDEDGGGGGQGGGDEVRGEKGEGGGESSPKASSMRMHAGCKLGKVYVCGLEAWEPEESYDLIWVQWCLGHLQDEELTGFLKRCGQKLRRGGWLVVKENLSTDGQGRDVWDEEDSSFTRADKSYRRLFEEAGWSVVKSELQRGFPKELYPVRFYALQPAE